MRTHHVLLGLFIFCICNANAQVAINTDASAPGLSSMLDVKSATKGVLIPRVSLTSKNVTAPVESPVASLMVYNLATAGTGTAAVVPGFYYWNVSSWVPIALTTNAEITGKNDLVTQSSLGELGTKKGYGAQAVNYIIALQGIFPCRMDCGGSNFNVTILGEIKLFAGNFAPEGWAFCNGQILPLSQNTALFSLLGTYYGGNGFNTFALPDLRSAVPLHYGTSTSGQTWDIGEKKD